MWVNFLSLSFSGQEELNMKWNKIETFISTQDRHYYMLEYQVPTENLLLSQVFHKLELLRKTNSIEDYSVTQTTLDQVIICLFFFLYQRKLDFLVWWFMTFFWWVEDCKGVVGGGEG